MSENWQEFGYRDEKALENSRILNEQSLYLRKTFGNQILHESHSELGKWLKDILPDVSYVNVFKSDDTYFRISMGDSYYPHISININYNKEDPKNSTIEVRALDVKKKELESDIFLIEDKNIDELKSFILNNKHIFNN